MVLNSHFQETQPDAQPADLSFRDAPAGTSSDSHNSPQVPLELAQRQPIPNPAAPLLQPQLLSGGSQHSLDTHTIEVKQSWQNTALVSGPLPADDDEDGRPLVPLQPSNAIDSTQHDSTPGESTPSPDADVRCQVQSTAPADLESAPGKYAFEFASFFVI